MVEEVVVAFNPVVVAQEDIENLQVQHQDVTLYLLEEQHPQQQLQLQHKVIQLQLVAEDQEVQLLQDQALVTE